MLSSTTNLIYIIVLINLRNIVFCCGDACSRGCLLDLYVVYNNGTKNKERIGPCIIFTGFSCPYSFAGHTKESHLVNQNLEDVVEHSLSMNLAPSRGPQSMGIQRLCIARRNRICQEHPKSFANIEYEK